MRLIRQGDVYVFECRFEERKLPKEARFWWNPREKRWETGSKSCARRLSRFATESALRELTIQPRRSFKPKAGERLEMMQARAHLQYAPRPHAEAPAPAMRLPVQELEGLESLYKKYAESIENGRNVQKRLT